MTMTQQAWYDKAFVSVCGLSGTETQLTAKTTSFKKSGGGFDIEGTETFGGKITRVGTKDDLEISFDGIPASHADFDWIFAGQTASTAFGTTGVSLSTSTITQYRVSLLWSNQTGITSAAQSITAGNEAYREVYANAYCTSLEKNMDAGDMLKATFTFKLADQDSSGNQNWMTQAKDTTSGTLSALNAYTSSTTKW